VWAFLGRISRQGLGLPWCRCDQGLAFQASLWEGFLLCACDPALEALGYYYRSLRDQNPHPSKTWNSPQSGIWSSHQAKARTGRTEAAGLRKLAGDAIGFLVPD